MVEQGGRPSLYWTYCDEDFGGSVAHLARRRGNIASGRATSESVLSRFKVRTPVCRIR